MEYNIELLKIRVQSLQAGISKAADGGAGTSSDVTAEPSTKVEEIPATPDNHLQRLPNEVLAIIFDQLDLRDRATMSMTCRQYRDMILLRRKFYDVNIFNIFPKSLWETQIQKNTSRITIYRGKYLDDLRNMLKYFQSSSVKIWYDDRQFAEEVIKICAESGVDMRCCDIYPYGEDIVVDSVKEHMPNISGISMRPHGEKYFWDGMTLNAFPSFDKLTTLQLDSFNISTDVIFPPSLRSFDFFNRNPVRLKTVVNQLHCLRNLQFLTLSHLDLTVATALEALVNQLAHLHKLVHLTLRSSRFADLGHYTANALTEKPLTLIWLSIEAFDSSGQTALGYLLNCSPKLETLEINVFGTIERIRSGLNPILEVSKSRQIALLLSIIYDRKVDKTLENGEEELLELQQCLSQVLYKLDLSFVSDNRIIQPFLRNVFPILTEIKLTQCTASLDAFLVHLSKNAPNLRRVMVIEGWEEYDHQGILSFVRHMDKKKHSCKLTLRSWKMGLTPIYDKIVKEKAANGSGMSDKKIHFFRKKFPDTINNQGARIHITSTTEPDKYLIIKNYNIEEANRMMGMVLVS